MFEVNDVIKFKTENDKVVGVVTIVHSSDYVTALDAEGRSYHVYTGYAKKIVGAIVDVKYVLEELKQISR